METLQPPLDYQPLKPILDPDNPKEELWPGLNKYTLHTVEECRAKRDDILAMFARYTKRWTDEVAATPINKQEEVLTLATRRLATVRNFVNQRLRELRERKEEIERKPPGNVVEFRKPEPLGIREARTLDLMAETECAPISRRPDPHVVLATNTVCWCTHDRKTHFKARLCEKWMVNRNSGWNNELKELVEEGYILRHYPGEVSGTTRPAKPPGSQLYFSFTQKARDLWKKHERKQA